MQPAAPYKGVLPFFEEDADFFFGRDEEIELVCEIFRTARLTVLLGAPAAGKTSLLRAGVVPRLLSAEKPERVIVFDAWRDNPIAHFIAALRHASYERIPTFLSLDSIVKTITAKHKLLVVLDQFEECVLRYPPFATELARLADQSNVHFLLSVRDDEEYALRALHSRLPYLFDSMLRLQPLTVEAARSAIVRPVEVFNWRNPGLEMHIEPEAVEAIVSAAKASPEAAHVDCGRLQRIAKALWDWDFQSGANTIRASTVEALLAEETRMQQAVPKHDEIVDDPRPSLAVAVEPPMASSPVLVRRFEERRRWRWVPFFAAPLIALAAVVIFQFSRAPEQETSIFAKWDEATASPGSAAVAPSPRLPNTVPDLPSGLRSAGEASPAPPASVPAQDPVQEMPQNTDSPTAVQRSPSGAEHAASAPPLQGMQTRAGAAQSTPGSNFRGNSPSVFIHVRERSDAALELVRQLEKNGIHVAGMKTVDRGPRTSDLRYFRRQEHDEAKAIAKQLQKLNIRIADVKYIGGYEGTARDRQYELWFPPEALR